MKYGFIPPQGIPDEDFVLGAIRAAPIEVLQPNGQWDAFLPQEEIQRKFGVETNACVTFGTLNALEMLCKRKFSIEPNYSERFTAIISGTDPNKGNSPNPVAEAIRKQGVIPEDLLPFDETIKSVENYYSPNPMNVERLEIAKKFLDEYTFNHEWVFKGKVVDKNVRLMEALKYSPVGASVVAWQDDGTYYVKPDYGTDNHWITIYGYEEGKYWKIFDHYDDSTKELVWNYNFGFAKRFHLEKKVANQPTEQGNSFWGWLRIIFNF